MEPVRETKNKFATGLDFFGKIDHNGTKSCVL